LPTAPRRSENRNPTTAGVRLPVATLAAATTAAAPPTAATSSATTAAAEASAAAATTTASSAATAATFTHGSRFVDHDVASFELLAVKRLDRFVCLFVILNFDKTEATGLTRETIANESNVRRSHTGLREPFPNFFFRRLKWKIPYVKLLHWHTP